MADLVRASHFPPAVGVTAMACLLALGAGRGAGTLWVGAAVFAGQLSVGWCNDWVDRERDRAAGRTDKPVATGAVRAETVLGLAVGSLAVCAVLSLPSGPAATAVHLLAVGLAWAYNLGLKATPFSVAPYAVAFGLLPAFVWLGLPDGRLPPAWMAAAGALLGAGAHFVNTLDDAAADAATGVRGLPQRLGPRGSLGAAAGLLAAAAVTVAAGLRGGGPLAATAQVSVALGGVLAVAVVLAGWRGRGRLAFHLVIGAAGAVVTAVVLAGAAVT